MATKEDTLRAIDKHMEERRFGTGTKIPQQSPQQLRQTGAKNAMAAKQAMQAAKQSARQQLSPPQQRQLQQTVANTGAPGEFKAPTQLNANAANAALNAPRNAAPTPAMAANVVNANTTGIANSGVLGQQQTAVKPASLNANAANAALNAPRNAAPTQTGTPAAPGGWKKGGKVKTKCYAKGGSVKSSASSRGDGCATKGHTRGVMR